MGRSKEKIRQRNRRTKIRQIETRNRIENRPSRLPKAVLPGANHLHALRAAYVDFYLAGQSVEQQRALFRGEVLGASVLQASEEFYQEKTNLMVLGCLQQSLVQHKATGKRYNFFGSTLVALMEHADPELYGTPFRYNLMLPLKPSKSRRVQHAMQAASMRAPPSKHAGSLGAALLRQFNTPPHQLKRTWFSNRGG